MVLYFCDGKETNGEGYSTTETCRWEKGDFLNDLFRSYGGPNFQALYKRRPN